jgi:hypothetical protein
VYTESFDRRAMQNETAGMYARRAGCKQSTIIPLGAMACSSAKVGECLPAKTSESALSHPEVIIVRQVFGKGIQHDEDPGLLALRAGLILGIITSTCKFPF